jgi:hypothetical protein
MRPGRASGTGRATLASPAALLKLMKCPVELDRGNKSIVIACCFTRQVTKAEPETHNGVRPRCCTHRIPCGIQLPHSLIFALFAAGEIQVSSDSMATFWLKPYGITHWIYRVIRSAWPAHEAYCGALHKGRGTPRGERAGRAGRSSAMAVRHAGAAMSFVKANANARANKNASGRYRPGAERSAGFTGRCIVAASSTLGT